MDADIVLGRVVLAVLRGHHRRRGVPGRVHRANERHDARATCGHRATEHARTRHRASLRILGRRRAGWAMLCPSQGILHGHSLTL